MRHYFAMQALPLAVRQCVCVKCGAVAEIGQWPTGKRAKCSRTRKIVYLPDGATGSTSSATGRTFQRTAGHAGYTAAKVGNPLKYRSNP